MFLGELASTPWSVRHRAGSRAHESAAARCI